MSWHILLTFQDLKTGFILTARKRSLGQGNVFRGVCLSMGCLYDVTSCLAAWSHVPSGGLCPWSHIPSGKSLSRRVREGGLCRETPGIRKAGGLHPTVMVSCVWILSSALTICINVNVLILSSSAGYFRLQKRNLHQQVPVVRRWQWLRRQQWRIFGPRRLSRFVGS